MVVLVGNLADHFWVPSASMLTNWWGGVDTVEHSRLCAVCQRNKSVAGAVVFLYGLKFGGIVHSGADKFRSIGGEEIEISVVGIVGEGSAGLEVWGVHIFYDLAGIEVNFHIARSADYRKVIVEIPGGVSIQISVKQERAVVTVEIGGSRSVYFSSSSPYCPISYTPRGGLVVLTSLEDTNPYRLVPPAVTFDGAEEACNGEARRSPAAIVNKTMSCRMAHNVGVTDRFWLIN